MSRGRYKIATVSRLTGFSPVLLRAWEYRHRLLAPSRGPGGQRLYSDDDVAVLRRVRELVDEGRSIGEIAAGGRSALLDRAPAPADLEAMLHQSDESTATRSMLAAAQAAARLTARLDAGRVLDVLVETLAGDFAAALARVWVFSPSENLLHLRASAGLSRRTTTSSRAHIDLTRYRYKVGVVARNREAFVSNAIVGDREFDQRWVKRERLTSVAILPLTSDGALRGVLAAFFRVAITDEVLSALGIFATIAASAIASVKPRARPPRRSSAVAPSDTPLHRRAHAPRRFGIRSAPRESTSRAARS